RMGERPDLAQVYGSVERYRTRREKALGALFLLRVVLYHRGSLAEAPRRAGPGVSPRPAVKSRMEAVVDRYLAARSVTSAPRTIPKIAIALRHFITWIARAHPD